MADLTQIEIADLDKNLVAEIDRPENEFTAWQYTYVKPDGYIDGNKGLHILHHAGMQRAGVVFVGSGSSGLTCWTDAMTPEEALQRYLAGEMAN